MRAAVGVEVPGRQPNCRLLEVAVILGCVFANSSLIAYRSTSLPHVIERTLGPNALRKLLGSSFDESARLEVGDTNIERLT